MSSLKRPALEEKADSCSVCTDSVSEVKKPRLEQECLSGLCLLDLDDPTLLHILTMLPLQDRLRVSDVCKRLKNICADRSLWTDVDTLAGAPIAIRDLRKLLKFLHDRTKHISIRGFLKAAALSQRNNKAVTPSVLAAFQTKCPELKSLSLVECYVDAATITIDMFPESIERLLFPRSEVINSLNFFKDMCLSLPNLRVLDVTGCNWVSSHSLMAICKCPLLEELCLKGCFQIGSVFVYSALACRHGFRKLKKVDLRDTSVGNNEVGAFGRLPELTHLKLGRSSADFDIVRPAGCEGDGFPTDRGLLSLCPYSGDSHVTKIQHLTVTHCNGVTNRSMSRLATSLPLKSIDVRGTKVSTAGAVALKSLRPNCEVVLESLPLEEGEEELPAELAEGENDVVVLQMQEGPNGILVIQHPQ